MRALKFALSVFGLFLSSLVVMPLADAADPAGWDESWGFKSELCNPNYVAPESCWTVTSTGQQKRRTDLSHCDSVKGNFTEEITLKFFDDFRTFKKHVDDKKKAGKTLTPASQSLLNTSLPSTEQITAMGPYAAMKENLQKLLQPYYEGNSFTNASGNQVACSPESHGQDGYYGLCTKAALESFIQDFNDDCKEEKKSK